MKKFLPEFSLALVALMYNLLSVATKYMDIAMTANIAFATRSFLAFFIGIFLYSIFTKQISFKKYKSINLKYWSIYLFLGFFGYGASVLFLSYGVLKTNIFTVATIYATIPFFVMFFEFVFFKSKPSLLKIFLILLSIFGVILSSISLDNNLNFGIGAFYILLATILSAIYIIGISKYKGDLNNKEFGIILMFFACIFGFIFSFIFGFSINFENVFNFYFIIGLFIGASFNLITSILEPWAMQKVKSASIGSQILLLEVPFAFVLGVILFSEFPSVYAIAGSVIIVISVAINNFLEN